MKRGCRLLAASFAVAAVFPCAIDTTPSFVPVWHPEKFDSAFVRGELGIISASLSGVYKLIAWRYLAGLPLDRPEQQAILDAQKNGPASPEATARWQRARSSVGGRQIFFNTAKSSRLEPGAFYDNCLADAFIAAARTLEDRQKRYANSGMLKDWVEAQDVVFQNCTSDRPAYPADPGSGLTPLARADRMYQIAAAHFYAEDLDGADRRFRAITADNNSPWRDIAAYMVARTLIRESSLLHKPGAAEQAKAQLQKIAGGPLRDSALGLITYVNSLSDPMGALKTLGDKLAIRHAGPSISDPVEQGAFALTSERFRHTLARSDLPEPFDWIEALGPDKSGYSMQRWRKSHSTLWLTAALVNAGAGQNENDELIDAALKVPRSSPAFDTVSFHSIRLMIGNGQTDSARSRLDVLLGGKRRKLNSVDNAFREQRMSLATSFDDFLRWAARRPIGIVEEAYFYDSSDVDDSPILAEDSLEAFNYFTPLTKLLEAAESSRLPEESRMRIAIAAWTRALVLGDEDAENRITPILAKAQRVWASDLEAFRDAAGEDKRFAGALLIARNADFHPHVWIAFAPDWWCAESLTDKPHRIPPEAALSRDDRTEASSEVQRIHNAGAAQTFLAPIIMSWATAHPKDSRVPEALHRLVRVTRYGCDGVAGNGVVSKAAFDLLHRRYPASDWTRQTPYWFNN